MKTILIAVAVLGLTASAALAECAYHTTHNTTTTTDEAKRISELEREVRELRRANEILKTASAFFARELDPRPPK